MTCAVRTRVNFDPRHLFLYHTGEYMFKFDFPPLQFC